MSESNMDIGKFIKQYREWLHLSQTQLAEKLGVSQRNVSYYESGERIPPADVLKKIATLFNVSVDVLLGLKKMGSDTNDCYYYSYPEGHVNWNIKQIAEKKGVSYEDLLEKTCIDKDRFDALWFSTSQPYAEELIRFSTVLDVSIDYLLEHSLREKLTVDEDLILRYYHSDPDNIKMLLESFDALDKKDRTILIGKCLELEKAQTVAADQRRMVNPGKSYPSTGTEGPGK